MAVAWESGKDGKFISTYTQIYKISSRTNAVSDHYIWIYKKNKMKSKTISRQPMLLNKPEEFSKTLKTTNLQKGSSRSSNLWFGLSAWCVDQVLHVIMEPES